MPRIRVLLSVGWLILQMISSAVIDFCSVEAEFGLTSRRTFFASKR